MSCNVVPAAEGCS